LKAIRRRFLDGGLCLSTINSYVNIVRQLFTWGCGEEIVSADIAGALKMVKSFQKGRSAAVEYDDILPVSDEIVEQTLPHMKYPQVQDMVRVQRRMGGRPQDMWNMRLCDIDQSGEIWRYKPFTHKTKKRGKIRELPIGPKAQQVLKPYLDKCKANKEQFVFPRPKAKSYDNWYENVIAAACRKAGVPVWTPNQLRHAAATEIRDKFGLEYAQAALGHASAKTTEIYAKVSFDKAAKVAKEIG